MRRRFVGLVMGIVFCMGGNQALGMEEVKIGVLLPLTGNIAFLGEPVTSGVDIAVDEINSKGGIKGKMLKVVYGDTKGDPKEAVNVFRQLLLKDKLKIFVTFLTGETRAVQPIAGEEGVLLMALSVYPLVAKKDLNTFRLSYSFRAEAKIIVENIMKKKPTGVCPIYSDDAASKFQVEDAFIPFLKDQGFSNIHKEPFKLGEKNFRSLVTRVKGQNPSDVFISGFGSDYPNLLKELKVQGLMPPAVRVWGGVPMWEVSAFVGTDMLNGIVFVAPALFVQNRNADIRLIAGEKFRNKKMPSNYFSFYAYDNIMILSQALGAVGEIKVKEIQDYIFGMKEYKGKAGTMTIDEKGSAETELALFHYQDGKMELMK